MQHMLRHKPGVVSISGKAMLYANGDEDRKAHGTACWHNRGEYEKAVDMCLVLALIIETPLLIELMPTI